LHTLGCILAREMARAVKVSLNAVKQGLMIYYQRSKLLIIIGAGDP
jgi:hypothetical protein